MAYDIWMKCYPQPDENLAEEFIQFRFDTKSEAEKMVKELEEYYDDEYWQGHPLHKAKFYVEEHIDGTENRINVFDFVESGPSIYYE